MQTRLACVLTLVIVFPAASARAAAPPAGVDAKKVHLLLRRLDHDNFHKRLEADNQLRGMGEAVRPYLIAELRRTKSLEVRHRIQVMLRDLSIRDSVPQLVALLNDKDAQQRARADFTLRQAGSSIVPLLEKQARSETDGQRRQQLEKIINELAPTQR